MDRDMFSQALTTQQNGAGNGKAACGAGNEAQHEVHSPAAAAVSRPPPPPGLDLPIEDQRASV